MSCPPTSRFAHLISEPYIVGLCGSVSAPFCPGSGFPVSPSSVLCRGTSLRSTRPGHDPACTRDGRGDALHARFRTSFVGCLAVVIVNLRPSRYFRLKPHGFSRTSFLKWELRTGVLAIGARGAQQGQAAGHLPAAWRPDTTGPGGAAGVSQLLGVPLLGHRPAFLALVAVSRVKTKPEVGAWVSAAGGCGRAQRRAGSPVRMNSH